MEISGTWNLSWTWRTPRSPRPSASVSSPAAAALPLPASPAAVAAAAAMSMRVGRTHKSGVERALLTVRARIQTAVDLLDDKESAARRELAEADKALRALEIRVSAAERRPRAVGEELLGDEGETSAETRRWLLKNFTEHDLEAADANEIQSASSSPSMEARHRRSSIQIIEDVQDVMLMPEISDLLVMTGSIDFDALALATSPEAGHRCISVFGTHVLNKDGMCKHMKESGWIEDSTAFQQAFLAFCSRLDSLYSVGAIYHSSAHAVDVAATTHWLMQSDYISSRTTKLDHFMAFAAAALHDVGHPGMNNLWHTKTMSPLALRYNDKSILENMHVALAFETMQRDPDCDWFSLLKRSSEGADPYHSANLQQYVRKGIINMVLATDMAKHSSHVQELKRLAEEHRESPDQDMREKESAEGDKAARQKALEKKMFLLETVVHAADISNPCKPRQIMLAWTRRVLSEFWAQGDEERRLRLEVSPLCDRESGMVSVPKGQLGFINFVVMPFFSPLAELVAEAQEAIEELVKNCEFWKAQDAAGTSFEEIYGADPIMPPMLTQVTEASEGS
mmetsp:Transcript_23624/g.62289  ORF Transcript_23624/g.62289 Transcript_23624/m.62289 type:complete len:567 (-) Transcript_23624:98-1798(-)